MKIPAVMFLLALGLVLVSPARAVDYEFSYFVCDPRSCSELSPLTTQDTAIVSFNSECTGGVVAGINASASIQVGVPTACHLPYSAYALVQTNTVELYDDNTCPPTAYYVSYVTPNGEVINSAGITVFHLDSTSGCDGSRSATTKSGTKPC